MGVFLDKPKKEKEFDEGEGNGLEYAMCSMQGWRVEMEDAHSINMNALERLSYFAVFDGHAGDFVSNYASDNLINTILGHDAGGAQVEKSSNGSPFTSSASGACVYENEEFRSRVTSGFLELDRTMKLHERFAAGDERSGSTAVATFITDDKIAFANCGDSRGLLCSGARIEATYDHKPSHEAEKRRIEGAGGSVIIQRVNGSLAVSRALGDYDYKNVPALAATQQLVSPEPDISFYDRSPLDEFVVLACDGIWDVMSNEDIVGYIRARLLVHSDLKKVCDELLETCLAKGSRDNMSVILIKFPSAPKVSEEAVKQEENLNSTIIEKVTEIVKKNTVQPPNMGQILEELTACNLQGLPPGGGIQAKILLIEQTFEKLVQSLFPDWEKQEDDLRTGHIKPFEEISKPELQIRKQEEDDDDDDDPIN